MSMVWDQGWANEMIDLLIEARDAIEKAKSQGKDRLDASVLHSIRVRYGTLVQEGWAANPVPEVGKRSATRRRRSTGSFASTASATTSCASPPTSTLGSRIIPN
ncbi:MAG: hypothetical protein ACYDDZ_14925, partial [Acidimicrobiales bacterium]